MANFQYEWWTVEILLDSGKCIHEFKSKSRDSVIRQIKKEFAYSNSEENLNKPFWERRNRMIEIYWDTLQMDRKGYQRRF